MIITNIGNPIYQRELLSDFFKQYNLTDKDIFSGYASPVELLDYQKDINKHSIKLEEIVRKYYSDVLQRPLSQTEYVICSIGGTIQAYNSVVWSISKLMNKNYFDKLKIFQINKPPTYNIYKYTEEIIPNTTFYIDTNINDFYLNKNSDLYNCDVGVIISPNNPDGKIINERKGYFQIIDSVYDIPAFTGQYKSVNTKYSSNEIYIQSMSKLGIPSYRFGWTITENPMIASKIVEYNNKINNGFNTASCFMSDTVINLLKINNNHNYIFNNCYNTFNRRKKELTAIFKYFNLYLPEYNMNNLYSPYFLIPISNNNMKTIGIDTRKGSDFFMSDNYSRINLMMGENDYKKMIHTLKNNLNKILI